MKILLTIGVILLYFIAWFSLIRIAHLPNVKDFKWLDIWIPFLLLIVLIYVIKVYVW